jgi:putative endonuclease
LASQRPGTVRRRLSPEAARVASAWRRGTPLSRHPEFPFSPISSVQPASSGVIRDGSTLALSWAMPKRFVYVLKNSEVPPRYHTGLSAHVSNRLAQHNAGNNTHTAKYRPWSIDVVIEVADERRAVALERYLKSGSGVAFATRICDSAPALKGVPSTTTGDSPGRLRCEFRTSNTAVMK